MNKFSAGAYVTKESFVHFVCYIIDFRFILS